MTDYWVTVEGSARKSRTKTKSHAVKKALVSKLAAAL